MSHLLRPLLIALAASLATAGMAQNPFWLHAHYQVNDCAGPQLGNLALEIYFGGTGNPSSQSLDWLVTTPNCSSSQLVGGYGPNTLIRLSATTMCNGTVLTLTDTIQFTSTPDTIDVYFNFECVGGNVTDCNGVVGGSAMPGTPCDDGDPLTVNDTWSEVCVCSGSPTSACAACFTVAQASNGGMLTPFTAEFTNCTAGSAPFNYLWTLPDGTTSSQANETYVFNAPGIYNVCLTIADANGCTSTQCDSVFVDASGNVSLYAPCTACVDAVPATNGPGGAPIPWTIDAVNCSSGGVQPVTYGYQWNTGETSQQIVAVTPGEYFVCIIMIDANGCSVTQCDSVFVDVDGNVLDSEPCAACVDAVPAVDGSTGGAIPWTVQANNCSTGGPGIYTYSTNWGDNTTDNASTHTYAAAGTYNVCITMVGNNGCVSNACDSVTIDADGVVDPSNCQAGFWVVQAYVQDSLDPSVGQPIPNELWLYNLSSGGTGNYQFFWDFGDGTSSTDPYPSHFYSSGGPYVLCLTLTDDGGCSDTFCDSVSVDEDGLYNGMIAQANYARSGFTLSVMNQAPTTVPEVAALRDTRVWPNPVDDELNLGFTAALNGKVDIEIIDLNGRTVYRTNVSASAGNNRAAVPVQDLPTGMYVLRISNMTTNMNIRFVKN